MRRKMLALVRVRHILRAAGRNLCGFDLDYLRRYLLGEVACLQLAS